MDFKCKSCGECCGPVPVTHQELTEIKQAVKDMPNKLINQLRGQKRDPFTCILLNTKTKRCSVYESRPEICKMFGFYQGMECPNNRSHATKSRGAGDKRLKEHTGKRLAGILSLQIGWNELLK